MDWFLNRLKERTSWDGVVLVLLACSIIWCPWLQILAWPALAWGVWSFCNGE